MKEKILRLLRENARLSDEDIAERLGTTPAKVKKTVAELEKSGLVKGYQALIDDSMLPESKVKAIISVNVRPEREGGFDKIARRLARFPQVTSLYLVSGSYDLEIEIQGETLQEIAGFVSSKLSSMDGVNSTVTHFILKKYKESGRFMEDDDEYKRLKISP
ncbi:MAG: Lrp/AsnC family transcriptional regulator [Victivallales bacterium]|nr:Lrp/AsnC family transcriptional regulator [Victivallales bacterium]